MAWQSPSITVKWGPYFAPDPTEQKAIIDLVVAAESLIPLRQRLEKVAPIFGIENIEAALEEVEDEKEANAQRELDAATAALDAEARARRTGADPDAKATSKGSGGGRAPSGKDNTR